MWNFTTKYLLMIGTGRQRLSHFVQMFGFCWVCICCMFVNGLWRASHSKSCLLFSRSTLLMLKRVLRYSAKVCPSLRLRNENWKNASIGWWGSDVKLKVLIVFNEILVWILDSFSEFTAWQCAFYTKLCQKKQTIMMNVELWKGRSVSAISHSMYLNLVVWNGDVLCVKPFQVWLYDCTMTVAPSLLMRLNQTRALSIDDYFLKCLVLTLMLYFTLQQSFWRPGFCISQEALVCNSVLCFKIKVFQEVYEISMEICIYFCVKPKILSRKTNFLFLLHFVT